MCKVSFTTSRYKEYYCKPCRNIYSKDYNKRNLAKCRQIGMNSHRKTKYGITAEEFKNLQIKQNYVCAICNNKCITGMNLAVDHDHVSGKIRGLLCANCNRGLGLFKDNVLSLEQAIIYLNREKF